MLTFSYPLVILQCAIENGPRMPCRNSWFIYNIYYKWVIVHSFALSLPNSRLLRNHRIAPFVRAHCKPPAVQCVAPPVKNQPSAVLSTPPKGEGLGANRSGWGPLFNTIPIGSMYGIYANIWGILMVNVTIYSIHGSYGIWTKLAVWISNAYLWFVRYALKILPNIDPNFGLVE